MGKLNILDAGIIALCLCIVFWKTVETINCSFLIQSGKYLKAKLGLIKDFVEPESIKNLRLCSGNIMYGSSLELIVFVDITCLVRVGSFLADVSENFGEMTRIQSATVHHNQDCNGVGNGHHIHTVGCNILYRMGLFPY